MPTIEATDEIKTAFNTAQRSAHGAANDLGCARSWLGADEDNEDNRDPAERVAFNLEQAERNANAALAAIKRLRELTTLTK